MSIIVYIADDECKSFTPHHRSKTYYLIVPKGQDVTVHRWYSDLQRWIVCYRRFYAFEYNAFLVDKLKRGARIIYVGGNKIVLANGSSIRFTFKKPNDEKATLT